MAAGMEHISGQLNCTINKGIGHFCRNCAQVKFGHGHPRTPCYWWEEGTVSAQKGEPEELQSQSPTNTAETSPTCQGTRYKSAERATMRAHVSELPDDGSYFPPAAQ